ncbi:FAD-dependent monooxygenase [Streptomyces sp. NPDC001393]
MSNTSRVLVDGGAAGNAVTVLPRRAGVEVDLIEARDDWNATAGSGITLQGNVLRELDVWEQVEASVEGSWHRGRGVLIGDAAHCCPPALAQGAALSPEDASVLAELLTGGRDWDDALLQEFYERRIQRVRPVVEASVQVGQWQLDGVRDADVPGLIARTLTPLRELP